MTEQRALIPAGGKLASIMPTSFEDVQRFANVAVKAGMFKGGDEETAMAQATLAVLQGLECGIPPVQAIQQIAIINGRATIWGDLVPALIWSRGHKIEEWIAGDGDERVAVCQITRGDNRERIVRDFSVKQAKQAKLWDTRDKVKRKDRAGNWYEKDNDSPWFRFPDRMLQMRARGFASRDGVPDVLRGMSLREEIEEEHEVKDITPVAHEPPAPPVPPEPPTIEDQTPPELNVPAFIANLDDELSAAQDEDTLGEIWTHHEGMMEDHLDRNQRDDALDIYKKHETRLNGQPDIEEAISSSGEAA